MHDQSLTVALSVDGNAQVSQTADGGAAVAAIEIALDIRGAVCQCAQQQSTVSDRLVARHAGLSLQPANGSSGQVHRNISRRRFRAASNLACRCS